MALTQYRPSVDLFRPLFEDFVFTPRGSGGSLLRAPDSDVLETENEIRVSLEMPGMKAEDIDIGLENNILTIRGEKREEREDSDERSTWHLSERRYGQFSRSFVLPRDVEADGIQAHFEDGVLRVRIPKSERARRRRIEVQGGDGQKRIEASGSETK
jgi:HSP20 family protein